MDSARCVLEQVYYRLGDAICFQNLIPAESPLCSLGRLLEHVLALMHLAYHNDFGMMRVAEKLGGGEFGRAALERLRPCSVFAKRHECSKGRLVYRWCLMAKVFLTLILAHEVCKLSWEHAAG